MYRKLEHFLYWFSIVQYALKYVLGLIFKIVSIFKYQVKTLYKTLRLNVVISFNPLYKCRYFFKLMLMLDFNLIVIFLNVNFALLRNLALFYM